MKLQAKFLFDPFGSQWGKSSKILKRFFSQAFPYFTSNLFSFITQDIFFVLSRMI